MLHLRFVKRFNTPSEVFLEQLVLSHIGLGLSILSCSVSKTSLTSVEKNRIGFDSTDSLLLARVVG